MEEAMEIKMGTFSSSIDNEKLVVEEFINCYKNNRVLWDSKCSKNVTRAEKEKIFNELAVILGKVKQDCTVEDVKKKINALRSNYRRALRKVRRSEALAAQNMETIFQPTLWWYDLMNFLEDVERPFDDISSLYSNGSSDSKSHHSKLDSTQRKRKKSNLSLPEYGTSKIMTQKPAQECFDKNIKDGIEGKLQVQLSEEHAKHMIFKQEREDTSQTPITNLQELHVAASDYHHNNHLNPITNTSTSNIQMPHSTNAYMDDVVSSYSYEPFVKNYKLLEPARELPSSSATITTAGECDTHIYLARLWADKLRYVHPRQRLYAEKAINDIIFEAELGTLNRNSCKINET